MATAYAHSLLVCKTFNEPYERIKKIPKAKGLTQDQFAELTGLNRVHLYRLESGKQSMTLRTLKLIADTLDVRVRDLIGNM